MDAGFPLEQLTEDGWMPIRPKRRWFSGVSQSQVSSLKDYLTGIVNENGLVGSKELDETYGELHDDVVEESDSDSDSDFEHENELYEDHPEEKLGAIRIQYTDPFAASAAVELATRLGKPIPKIVNWNGDVLRIQDPIPYGILYKHGYRSRSRKPCKFTDLFDPDVTEKFILHNTFWGRKIFMEISKDPRSDSTDRWTRNWYKKLWAMISSYLLALPNPLVRAEEAKTATKGRRARKIRFLQMLRTIDGIFAQKFLAYPDNEWSWQKYDNFVVGMIWMLLPEEFLDDDIEDVTTETTYETLKRTRKAFKEAFLTDRLPEFVDEMSRAHISQQIFLPEYRRLMEERDTYYRMQIGSLMCQSRGMGTPPPIVAMRAKIKFIKTVSAEPAPENKYDLKLVTDTLKQILSELPDEYFTGLTTKAGIRVNTNACLEKTREQGGTASAINDFVYTAKLGRKCQIYDLDTGEPTHLKTFEECTVGEYIFWRALEEVLATPIEKLKEAYIVGVQEPSKTRVITKATASLKIVLELVHGVCSYPLGKIPSSVSGMTKDNHGWNLFKDFFSHSDILFNEIEKNIQQTSATNYMEERLWADIYILSTDYSTATDALEHSRARILGVGWMIKCGIPPLLRGIAEAICFQPRTLIFKAKGALKGYGEPYKDDLNKVLLRKGILMGDPLTKVILHLTNICVRKNAMSIQQRIAYDIADRVL
jgi:hypothetical protein